MLSVQVQGLKARMYARLSIYVSKLVELVNIEWGRLWSQSKAGPDGGCPVICSSTDIEHFAVLSGHTEDHIRQSRQNGKEIFFFTLEQFLLKQRQNCCLLNAEDEWTFNMHLLKCDNFAISIPVFYAFSFLLTKS